MYPLALILAGVFFPLPPTEAELLLAQMDAKIAAAKTLRIEFELLGGQGLLVIGDNNRFRYEEVNESKWAKPMRMVCDGKRIAVRDAGRNWEFPKVQPWYGESLHSWLGRGGTVLSAWKMVKLVSEQSETKPGPADRPRLLNPRLLPDEEVNGINTHVVEYELTWNALFQFQQVTVRTWIDAKTKLPVRRTMTGTQAKWNVPFEVTVDHTKFEINPKLDDKLFEIPK